MGLRFRLDAGPGLRQNDRPVCSLVNLTVLVERLNLETFFIFKLGHCEIQIKPRPVPGRPEVLAELGHPQIQDRPLIKGGDVGHPALSTFARGCYIDARIQDVAPI